MTFDETLDQLDRALATTGRIVAGVAGDQWGDPTPCAGWDVRQVANHLVGGTLMGLLGALVAIPVTASILLIIKKVYIPKQDAQV